MSDVHLDSVKNTLSKARIVCSLNRSPKARVECRLEFAASVNRPKGPVPHREPLKRAGFAVRAGQEKDQRGTRAD